jgi:hypothetical protein
MLLIWRPISSLALVSGLKSFSNFPGEWIVDNGNDCNLAQRRVHGLPGFDRNVINERKRALDLHR